MHCVGTELDASMYTSHCKVSFMTSIPGASLKCMTLFTIISTTKAAAPGKASKVPEKPVSHAVYSSART